MDPTIYEIDRDDRLRLVAGAWSATTLENGTPHLEHGVVGRSLWDFVAGHSTRNIYALLVERARAGRTFSFPFRCDSPTVRRYMRMRMLQAADEGVRFEAELLTARMWPGSPGPFLADALPDPLRVCSWCKRARLGQQWEEPEVMVERVGMFIGVAEPMISHGICPDCSARLELAIASS